jgi:lipopolysaccharide biosynthesis regulator YciM
LKKALNSHRGCVRANLLQAQFAADQGDYRAAVRVLRETAERDADYLPEVLPDIVANYRQLGDLKGLRGFLSDTAATHPGGAAVSPLADLIKEREGEKAAASYLAEQLAKAPSLSLLLRSIELNAGLPKSQSVRFLDSLRPHIHRLLEDKPLYQCGHCGFEAKTLYWQCPSCRRWSTIKRKVGNGAGKEQ